MLFKVFALLCVVAVALAADSTLKLNQVVTGTASAGAAATYSFTYDHSTARDYQFLYVLPTSADVPDVTILKNTTTTDVDVDCSVAGSSAGGQVKCAYSFQGCVKTTKPDFYTITVARPSSAANADVTFDVGVVSANASLSAVTKTKSKLTTCCGLSGASWHYVKAQSTEVLETISLTITNGSLTIGTAISGSLFVPPGIFVIPDTSVCTGLNLASLTSTLSNLVKASTSFGINLSSDSSSTTVELEVAGKAATPGVSYWVLVVSSKESSAQYTLSATFSGQSTSAASTLSSPFAALF